LLSERSLSSDELVELYLDRIERIDRSGPAIRSIIETNPDVHAQASELDEERSRGRVRGPLHGIPILLKDNISTADSQHTTAGSLALIDWRPMRDAFVAQRLRAAGAILLGKANMSEWANFRSTRSSSGWSGRGGQALNPYALDRTPSGSSSGSASAVAAGLAAASLGTETDGSILSPAGANGVVGIKPTVGLTSRAGVIPIAHSQDTVGTFGRSVYDAAAVLGAITGVDLDDRATAASEGRSHGDYLQFLQPDGLRGARIGIAREVYFGFHPASDRIAEHAIEVLRSAGADIVDRADIPTAREIHGAVTELTVLLYEFKAGLNGFLAGLHDGVQVRSLADLIAFNVEHAEEEMPYFDQELLEMAEEKGPLNDPEYLDALRTNHVLSRDQGIDAILRAENLDALMMPTGGPATKIDLIAGCKGMGGSSQPAALAGYPAITVPAGYVSGVPVGITFVGGAFSEATLIRLAYAYEQATNVWEPPPYTPYT